MKLKNLFFFIPFIPIVYIVVLPFKKWLNDMLLEILLGTDIFVFTIALIWQLFCIYMWFKCMIIVLTLYS